MSPIMKNPIIVALDVNSPQKAQDLVTELEQEVGGFKVGLELFIAAGRLPLTSLPIVLDLKLHDIPETVAKAVKAGGNLGAKFMTLHIQQRAALEAAMKAAEEFDLTLLGVTVLTSMTEDDLRDLRQPGLFNGFYPKDRAEFLATLGYEVGLRGFVCSPQEVAAIKRRCPDGFFLVPGIRPAGADLNDQKRVATPQEAINNGADLIVIGRPITAASSPKAAAAEIAASIHL